MVVTPNQWSTRPDPTGRFSLAGVLPGKYTIVAWHRSVGFLRQQVEVRPNETTPPITFVLPFTEDEKPIPLPVG